MPKLLAQRNIFCDDAPAAAPIPWTCYVASGTGPGQAYYVCDKPATKDDAKRVAAALGCDPSGVSLCKVVRVPGTFNTKPKHGGAFAVRVQAQRRGVVALATLRDTYPALVRRSAPGGAGEATVQPTGELFNADRISTYRTRFATRTALLRTVKSTVDHVTRIPDRVKLGTLTYRLLTEATYRYEWKNASGSWDASRVRYHICLGLIERGYDCDFIVAYLDYCEEPETRALKGAHNLQGDYARLFAPDKLGTRYAQKQAEQRAYRARSDRPQQYTADSYYAWLQTQQQDGTVPHKRRERAALAGISTATLDRLEDALEQAERIKIDTANDRSGSIVRLKKGLINIVVTVPEPPPEGAPGTPPEVLSGLCTEHAVYRTTTGENATPPVMHKNTSSLLPVLAVLADAQTAAETAAETPCNEERSAADAADAADATAERGCVLTHINAATEPAPAAPREWLNTNTGELVNVPSLRAAVADALDTLRPYQEARRKVAKRTGEVTEYTVKVPVTAARVFAYLNTRYPANGWTLDVVTRFVQAERKRRRAGEWVKLRTELRAMDAGELNKRIATMRKALARNMGKKSEGRYRKRLEIALEIAPVAKVQPTPPTRVAVAAKIAPPASVPDVPTRYDVPGMIAGLKARLAVTA